MADGKIDVDSLVDKIIKHATERDDSHLPEFGDPKLGPVLDIKTPQDLRKHLLDTINDKETVGYVATPNGNKMYFLNERTNTQIILDPAAPGGGTIYRPRDPKMAMADFEGFIKKSFEINRVMPEKVVGGYGALADNFKTTKGFWPNLGETFKGKNLAITVAVGTGVAIMSYADGAEASEALKAGAQTLNPIPETTDAFMSGESNGVIAQAATKDASILAGCAAGGYVGATYLSPGSVVGVAIGGIGGCAVGAWVAGDVTQRLIDFFKGDGEQPPLDEIRAILPDEEHPDMPPEFEALRQVSPSDTLMQSVLDDVTSSSGYMMGEELEMQSQMMSSQPAPAPEMSMAVSTPATAAPQQSLFKPK